MKKFVHGISFAAALLAAPIFAQTSAPEAPAEAPRTAAVEATDDAKQEWLNLSRGVRYQDLHIGDGKKPALWSAVYVHYKLTAADGTVLADTFRDYNRRAAKHIIGAGTMQEVLEMAVGSMRERGRRALLIPADLFTMADFHKHDDDSDEHDHDREIEELEAALRSGTDVQAELSLMWVREYDPSGLNRFR